MKILVIGINIRHIACSASRAGHEVIAVDCFCDLDLESCAKATFQMPRNVSESSISNYVERFRPDAVVLGPGLEEAHVQDAAQGVPVLNNSAKIVAKVSDKLWLARWLEENGFPAIKTKSEPSGLEFPFLVKPRKGAGGVGCRLVKNAADLDWTDDLIAQEYVCGKPSSVSVIGNGHAARAVAANEQLVGETWAGAEGFRYVGNITPLADERCGMIKMAEEIVAGLGLFGSNGVDFLQTPRGPVVVEVNSRFQGSLDAVEKATGLNIFQAHLESFAGDLPRRPCPRGAFGRAIIYAGRDTEISEDLRSIGDWIADVPRPGSRMSKGEPILSILAEGCSRDEVYSKLNERAAQIYRRIAFKI